MMANSQAKLDRSAMAEGAKVTSPSGTDLRHEAMVSPILVPICFTKPKNMHRDMLDILSHNERTWVNRVSAGSGKCLTISVINLCRKGRGSEGLSLSSYWLKWGTKHQFFTDVQTSKNLLVHSEGKPICRIKTAAATPAEFPKKKKKTHSHKALINNVKMSSQFKCQKSNYQHTQLLFLSLHRYLKDKVTMTCHQCIRRCRSDE